MKPQQKSGRFEQRDNYGSEFAGKLKNLETVSAETIVETADAVGKYLGRKTDSNPEAIDLKVNQIRRFLDAVRKIENDIKAKSFDQVKDAIVLLRPKLAYAAGREPKVKPLMNVLDPAICSGAKSEENFQKLLKLIEGIIAYHRYYGGSN
jgi:CRISPR-associated protein Csm2